jgi:CRISPR-associated protein Csm1
VDNLGTIFNRGFGGKVSIGRIVSLSRQLDTFFKVILPDLFDHHIYVVFTGGDDLFIVGTWDILLENIKTIYNQFTDYVCKNPNITFSGGFTLGKPKSPIDALGNSSDYYLEEAKDHGRNRIVLLDREFTWQEFLNGWKFAKDFDDLIKKYEKHENKIPQGFIYRLLIREKQAFEIRQKVVNKKPIERNALLWRSHLNYDLTRNLSNLDESDKKWMETFTSHKDRNQVTMPAHVRLATTYVLYKSRS